MNFEPRQKKLRHLLSDFSNGAILLPQFQRDYVWPVTKIRNLLDSLLRGFPIGAFYLWEPTPGTGIDAKGKTFGKQSFLAEAHSYLIDGQQRLTGLEAAYGLYSGEDKAGSELRCYLDLAAVDVERGRDTRLFVSYGGNRKIADRVDHGDSTLVPLSRLLNGPDPELRREVEEDLLSRQWEQVRVQTALARLDRAFAMLEQLVPYTVITDATDQEAVEIFSRLNKGGKPLSQGDVKAAELARGHAVDVLKRMRAFATSERSHRLGFGFSFAFRALVLFHQGSAQFKSLRPDWIESTGAHNRPLVKSWDAAEAALTSALKFIDEMGWSQRILVPSANALIVFAAALDHDDLRISAEDRQMYQRFLCLSALRGTFQASVETTINKFYKAIRAAGQSAATALVEALKRDGHKIRTDELDTYAQAWGPATQVMHAWLVSRNAKDWLNRVPIDELARSAQNGSPGGNLTVHHIFPRKVLSDAGNPDDANCPANYALVSQSTNSEFREKPPEDVFAKLTVDQRKLAEVQFFEAGAGDRLRLDQYEEFCKWRAQRLAAAINQWLGL